MKLPAALYRIENLQRAWRWIRSNPDAGDKTYFREHYAACTTAQEVLLKDLSVRPAAPRRLRACAELQDLSAQGLWHPAAVLAARCRGSDRLSGGGQCGGEPSKALRLAAAAGRPLPIVCAGPLATMEPKCRAGY